MENTTSPKKKHYTGLLTLFWSIFLLGFLAVFLLFFSIANAWFSFDELPTFEELENPKNFLATEVYSFDNVLLGKYFVQDRSNATFDELSNGLLNAFIASEDIRFYEHCGIDFKATMRAVFYMGKRGGGSTITQQLAKNLFHQKARNFVERVKQKLQEYVISVKLEKSYTKEEIITMYFNTVPFSSGAYGIKAAAKTFFNTDPMSLSVQQAAILVGMLQASTKYNPHRNPENATKKRNSVLRQMEKYGFLTAAASDSIQQMDLGVDYNRPDHNEGLATYFREHVRSEVKKWLIEYEKLHNVKYDIHRDGLKIYTTIDSKMQQYAEESLLEHVEEHQEKFDRHWGKNRPWDKDKQVIEKAVKRSERYRVLKKSGKTQEEIDEIFNTPVKMTLFSWKGEIDTIMTPLDSLKYNKMFLHSGFLAINPENGQVQAWAGGINHKFFKYDNVRLSSKRQVGSTFKPFVYAMAVGNGYSPCQRIPNIQVCIPKGMHNAAADWCPKGSTRYDNQLLDLKFGLAKSLNWVTAYLMKEIGPEPIIELAKKMGIQSHMDPYPSVCLGTPDISLFEMVGAYSSFGNGGQFIEPTFLTRIEDKNGQVIGSFSPKTTEVMDPKEAYIMLQMMSGVVDYGTAVRLRSTYGFQGDIAGKTGTTDDNSDGWFIGITPQLVGGAWTGGDEKAIHFRSNSKDGEGGRAALPIWGKFMKRVYADPELGIDPLARFVRPEGRLPIELDCSKYQNPSPDDLVPEDRNAPPVIKEVDEEEFFDI